MRNIKITSILLCLSAILVSCSNLLSQLDEVVIENEEMQLHISPDGLAWSLIHKPMLKDWDQEYILLVDEQQNFELQPYEQVKDVAGGSKEA
jgi:hypothetical protein